jgi:ATP-binding cassette subfamily F protein 3
MLSFTQLSLRRGTKALFSDMDVMIHARDKTGVIGANGCGKSSLFDLILGRLQADSGDYRSPAGMTTAHVAQETPATAEPAVEYVMGGDEALIELLQALAMAEEAHDGERQGTLHAEIDAIDGYAARSRAAKLMQGLGFASNEIDNTVQSFSGGWRARLNLARALMCRSDLLLLDEPTNHLDLDAVIWLEGWLQRYPGTLMLISHDRDFLDAVCNQILHVEHQQVHRYSGNYSAFEHQRGERLAQQQAAHAKQQREIAHMRSYIDRFRAQATKARQAQSRLKLLARMVEIAPAHVDSPFHFEFREPERTPNPLLRLEDAATGYDGHQVLSDVNLTISPGARIGLLGPNGAGKSTLVKLLAGSLPLMHGKREAAQDLKLAYFAQHQLEQLDPSASPLEHLMRMDTQAREQTLRDFLGGFGFIGDQALARVAPFSGGEKSRLALALQVYQKPNLLLLDEPTNHLDLEMRHALGEALLGFKGAVILVSHDRHLLRLTAEELLLVDAGRLCEFDQSLDEYPAWLARRATARNSQSSTDSGANTSAGIDYPISKKDRKREAAERRQRLQPLRKQLQKLETEMEKLHQQQSHLAGRLADPALYENDAKTQLMALLDQKATTDKALATKEADWLELTETLESAEATG